MAGYIPKRSILALSGLTVILASSAGCSCSSPSGGSDAGVDASSSTQDGSVDGSTGQDGSVDGGVLLDGDVTIQDGGVVLLDGGGECFVKICIDSQNRQIRGQCGDCVDNDDDGLADQDDPECLNFCDDHEASYSFFDPSSGGGDTPNCNLDCYYDPDVGSGNDGCRWNGRCDPLSPDPLCSPYSPGLVGGNSCPNTQSASCATNCRPLVPNGCDCFGCCELPAGSGDFVFIGTGAAERAPTCTEALAEAGDTEACAPCTPRLGDDSCYNSCLRCELCLGKTVDDLPCDCFTAATAPSRCDGVDAGVPDGGTPQTDGGVPYECPDGPSTVCGFPGTPECPFPTYCLTGCCVGDFG